jgi:hypothetical protein
MRSSLRDSEEHALVPKDQDLFMNERGLRREGTEVRDGTSGAACGGQVAEVAVSAR